jgi:hypothetical protein
VEDSVIGMGPEFRPDYATARPTLSSVATVAGNKGKLLAMIAGYPSIRLDSGENYNILQKFVFHPQYILRAATFCISL